MVEPLAIVSTTTSLAMVGVVIAIVVKIFQLFSGSEGGGFLGNLRDRTYPENPGRIAGENYNPSQPEVLEEDPANTGRLKIAIKDMETGEPIPGVRITTMSHKGFRLSRGEYRGESNNLGVLDVVVPKGKTEVFLRHPNYRNHKKIELNIRNGETKLVQPSLLAKKRLILKEQEQDDGVLLTADVRPDEDRAA